jgi:hypothetical protein
MLDQQTSASTRQSGLAVGLGGSVNYYYGQANQNIGSFDQDRLNWEINGLVGVTLARNATGKRTLLAVTGTLGFLNAFSMQQLLKDQDYTTSAPSQSHLNNYYLLEGGIIINEILRISTGVGQQNFNNQTLVSGNGSTWQTSHMQFQVTTIGLQFNVGHVWWMFNCHVLYGKDFSHTALVPQTGLIFQFQ